jgi:hypothetical protein
MSPYCSFIFYPKFFSISFIFTLTVAQHFFLVCKLLNNGGDERNCPCIDCVAHFQALQYSSCSHLSSCHGKTCTLHVFAEIHSSFRITNIVNFLSQTFVFLQDMLFKIDSGFELHNNLTISIQFMCNI